MGLWNHIRNACVALPLALAGELMIDLTGVREIVQSNYPILAAFLPHIGFALFIGALSFFLEALWRWWKTWERQRQTELVNDMERLVHILSSRNSITGLDARVLSKEVLTMTDKYRQWFSDITGTMDVLERAKLLARLTKTFGRHRAIARFEAEMGRGATRSDKR